MAQHKWEFSNFEGEDRASDRALLARYVCSQCSISINLGRSVSLEYHLYADSPAHIQGIKIPGQNRYMATDEDLIRIRERTPDDQDCVDSKISPDCNLELVKGILHEA